MTTSEQARADAMADAETLRLVSAEVRPKLFATLRKAAGGLFVRPAFVVAQASAAFRAVPALREQ